MTKIFKSIVAAAAVATMFTGCFGFEPIEPPDPAELPQQTEQAEQPETFHSEVKSGEDGMIDANLIPVPPPAEGND